MNRALVFDLATAAFIGRREDGLFMGPPGAEKAILPKPSDMPSSCKATACSIAKRMFCWKIWPTPP